MGCSKNPTCTNLDPYCTLAPFLLYSKQKFPTHVYSGNPGGANLQVFAINPSNNTLIPGVSTPAASPLYLSIHSNGHVLYSANSAAPIGISSYLIDASTGNISLQTTQASPGPIGMIIGKNGHFGYLVDSSSLQIQVYRLNGSTGAMTFVNYISYPSGYNFAVINKEGTYLFGASTTGRVDSFKIYPDNHFISFAGTASVSGAAGVAVDPFGRFLYVTSNSSTLTILRIESNGSISVIGTAPTGSFNTFAIASPNGRHVYVTNQTTSDVSALSVDDNGNTKNIGNTPLSYGPLGITMDASGLYLFTNGATSISMLSVDPYTGIPTLADTQTTGASAQAMAVLNQSSF